MSADNNDTITNQVFDNVSSIVLWVFSAPWLLIGCLTLSDAETWAGQSAGGLFLCASVCLCPPLIKEIYRQYALQGREPIPISWLVAGYFSFIVAGFYVAMG